MSKSSINFQTAKSNSSAHMKRDSFVSYLLEHENNHFEYKHYQDPEEYLEYAQVQTKLLTKRKMQSKAVENFVQEAVLNIKKDTTIEEVENLFKTYNKEFGGGFMVFELALHRDEGVFIDTKYNIDDLVFDSKTLKIYKDGVDVSDEVISLAPNKDIFYNKETKKWYKEKTFKTEIDTSKLQKKINYHAHISFTKWNELTGKNIRLQKSDLQKIQTITAREMGMERGERNSQTKRMNHYQIKKLQADLNEQKLVQKELKLVTVPQLKQTIKELRAELKENKATRSDYAALEQLNKDLKAKVAAKDLTIAELEAEIKEHVDHKKILVTSVAKVLKQEQKQMLQNIPNLEERHTKAGEFLEENEIKTREEIKTLKNELQATNTKQTSKYTQKRDLSDLEQDLSDLRAKNEKLVAVNNQIIKDIKDVIPVDFEPKKSLKERFMGFIKNLKESIKAQASEIFSLRKENNVLYEENVALIAQNERLKQKNEKLEQTIKPSEENGIKGDLKAEMDKIEQEIGAMYDEDEYKSGQRSRPFLKK